MMNNAPPANEGKRGCHGQSDGRGTIGIYYTAPCNIQVFEDDHESYNFKLIAYQGFRV